MIKLKLDTSRKERHFRRQFATNIRLTAHILDILLMNSCNTDIFFSNYYHLLSVHFELLSSNPLRKTKYVIKGYVSVRVDRLT